MSDSNEPTEQLIHGDCLVELRKLPDNSIDSLVTDPPAGISFMSRNWDSDKGGRDQWIGWMTEVMAECLRVMRPGAHGLVWALPRTQHWTATALENAGFEIRDCISHMFGSGFPKSLDIGKAVDKLAGAEREVVGTRVKKSGDITGGNFKRSEPYPDKVLDITSGAATDAAKQWDGWGTALKPGHEVWILVRKPLAERSIAAQVLATGTGGIHIDACRVGTEARINGPAVSGYMGDWGTDQPQRGAAGRWPANVLLSHGPNCQRVGERKVRTSDTPERYTPNRTTTHTNIYANGAGIPLAGAVQYGYGDADGMETVPLYSCEEGCPVAGVDGQSGVSGRGDGVRRVTVATASGEGTWTPGGGWCAPGAVHTSADYGDQGGASRFFTVMEPERGTRPGGFGDVGADKGSSVPNGPQYGDQGGASRFFPVIDPPYLYTSKAPSSERPEVNGVKHETVKSVELMRWLTKLITPPGGVVLDCFAGSGSTVEACIVEGFGWIAIEAEADYVALIKARLGKGIQPGLF